MHIVTISSKSQITIPKKLLSSLDIKPKQKVLIEKSNDTLLLKPLKKSVVDELAGSLNKYIDPKKLGASWETIMDETKKEVAKHLVQKYTPVKK